MAHHAYFTVGDQTLARSNAQAFVERELGKVQKEVIQLSFELFSVDDARRLIQLAGTSGTAEHKVLIASFSRIFHEAQNALLKILEEPPPGTLIILCLPSEGMLLPTLRSRLLPLPLEDRRVDRRATQNVTDFLNQSESEQRKSITQLLERAKSDKEEVKQQARREAIELLQGITEATYADLHTAKTPEKRAEAHKLLQDLAAFLPILYERSTPLKLIFEHLLLVLPRLRGKAAV